MSDSIVIDGISYHPRFPAVRHASGGDLMTAGEHDTDRTHAQQRTT